MTRHWLLLLMVDKSFGITVEYIVKKRKKTKAMRIEIACVAGVIVL